MTIPDEDFARAFAPMLEVQQGGAMRPATPADVLELISAPRYVLKLTDGRYVGDPEKPGGKGYVPRQRDAIVAAEREWATEMSVVGLEEYGVRTRVVRLRRKGTLGIKAVRIRPDISIKSENGMIGFGISDADAKHMLAALAAGKRGGEI